MFLFRAPSRAEAEWYSVGLSSSFPDLGLDDEDLSQPRHCNGAVIPGCRVFNAPKLESPEKTKSLVEVEDIEACSPRELNDQILVFQYRGKFHAVDHVSQMASDPS